MASMKKVKVELGVNSYDVRVGSGLLTQTGLLLKELGLSGKAVIITDTTVKGLYSDIVSQSMAGAGFLSV